MVPRPSVAGFAAYAASRMGAFGLMLAVAAEGEEHGIRANEISPVVTGTRTSTRTETAELAPELVVPAVLHLASADCDDSGIVVHAEGGSFHTFFCQAEDGIRFLYVTGVQTCALPICAAPLPRLGRHDRRGAGERAGRAGDRLRGDRRRRRLARRRSGPRGAGGGAGRAGGAGRGRDRKSVV